MMLTVLFRLSGLYEWRIRLGFVFNYHLIKALVACSLSRLKTMLGLLDTSVMISHLVLLSQRAEFRKYHD